jgi:hypothetical protein
MRKLTFFIALIFALTLNNFAQAPQAIKYQAVVRDVDGNVLRSQAVGVQFHIHQSTEAGTVVYTETFATTSNTYGLINLEVGTGTSIDDFSAIDWASGPYFLETAIDVAGGTAYVTTGTNEFLSSPYALYSNTAGYANGGDYNSLDNKPTTITPAQAAKVDLLTVTSALNLDVMSADVVLNNAKVSFPGFGTVPGLALEGDQFIWEKSGNDIFYTTGNVGIGVPTNSPFGGSKLHVGGGILYDGIPSTFAPGMLYYDDSGDGVFHYVDNTNTDYELGPGAVAYNDTLWKTGFNLISSQPYVITDKDVIISRYLGLGVDITENEVFNFDDIIIKENNVRMLFDDSDDPAGTMPANDWQIEINSSANGGTSHFAILDVTGGTSPFKVMAGAPNNSLYVGSDGKVGLGTTVIANELTVNGAVKADAFIGDGSGLTGITGGTGGVSDPGDVILGADTDNDTNGEIALQTQNTTRMTITNDGKVGIGIANPGSELEVAGDATFQDLTVNGNASMQQSMIYTLTTEIYPAAGDIDYDVTDKSIVTITASAAQNLTGFVSGISGQEVTVINRQSDVTIKHNGTGTQKIMLPGAADIVISAYESARFICDGTNWYCIGLNN